MIFALIVTLILTPSLSLSLPLTLTLTLTLKPILYPNLNPDRKPNPNSVGQGISFFQFGLENGKIALHEILWNLRTTEKSRHNTKKQVCFHQNIVVEQLFTLK